MKRRLPRPGRAGEQDTLAGDPRVGAALWELAQVLAEIARTSVPNEEAPAPPLPAEGDGAQTNEERKGPTPVSAGALKENADACGDP